MLYFFAESLKVVEMQRNVGRLDACARQLYLQTLRRDVALVDMHERGQVVEMESAVL